MLAAAAWVALLFTTTVVTATANYLNGDESVARLTTGLEPYGTASPSPGQLRHVTVEGPVRIRTLTQSSPGRAFEVTATDAWLTPGGAEDADRLRFHVHGGHLDRARVRFPAGTKVDDVGSGRLVVLGRARTLSARTVDLVLTDPGHTALVLPPVLIWSPIAQLVWLLAAGGVLLYCWLRFSRHCAAGSSRHPQPTGSTCSSAGTTAPRRSTGSRPGGSRPVTATRWSRRGSVRRSRTVPSSCSTTPARSPRRSRWCWSG